MARRKLSNSDLALFALLLFLDTSAILLQKYSSTAVHPAGSSTSAFYTALVQQPLAWLAVALGPLQLLIWTRILARVDLGLAYPLTTLSYPISMFAAAFLFREHLTWPTWIGAALITAGASLLRGEEHPDPNPVDRAKQTAQV